MEYFLIGLCFFIVIGTFVSGWIAIDNLYKAIKDDNYKL